MKSRRLKVVVGSAVVAVAAGVGVYLYVTREIPNPAAGSVTSAAKSGDYASVRKAIEAGQLKVDDVRLAVREEFQNQTIERVNSYFDTTDGKAKQAILDKAIDDLERFRAEGKKRAAASQPTTKSTVPTVNPQLAMVGWALSQPAATRARLAEFRVAFEKRRTERGLPGLFEGGESLPLGQPTKR